jgi:hypothetical protein
LEGLSSLPIGRIDRLNRNKRDHRLVVARESGRAKVPIPISQKRWFFRVSAIQRVSRTELGLLSVQPPLDTADIVSFRVCHPQPIGRRFGILISEMSFSHSLQSGSR